MKNKIIILSSLIVVLLLLVAGSYVYSIYHSVQKTANTIYQPLKTESTAPVVKVSSTKTATVKPISILLMGVDQRKYDKGRSDTLIVLTLNPETKTMQMVSIPRDTRAELGNTGTVTKINAAYFYGGPDLAVQTVDQFLNIHLDYYIRINMQGLVQLVDSLGGITVNNAFAWHDEGYYKKGYLYKKGIIYLNGAQALGFSRMRHLDPQGDFGRNKRQRQVIKAIVSKASNFKSITKYQDILNAIQNNVMTNISFDEMKYIVKNYRSAKNHIINYEVQGQGATINKLWYLIVDNAEKQKVHKMITNQLNDNTSPVSTDQSTSSQSSNNQATSVPNSNNN